MSQLEHAAEGSLHPSQPLVGRQLQVLAQERPIDVPLEDLDDRIRLQARMVRIHCCSVPRTAWMERTANQPYLNIRSSRVNGS